MKKCSALSLTNSISIAFVEYNTGTTIIIYQYILQNLSQSLFYSCDKETLSNLARNLQLSMNSTGNNY